MVLGLATPNEAAALGALSMTILAVFSRRINWGVFKKITLSTLRSTGMIFIVLGASQVFSQMLAASSTTQGLAAFVSGLKVTPILIIIGMQILLVVFLGCLMDVVSIMMITLSIFMPIVRLLGYNELWFITMYLVNIELAGISPPFGMSLFTIKAVVPDVTIREVYAAAIPFCLISIIVIALILVFPQLALWLPELAYK